MIVTTLDASRPGAWLAAVGLHAFGPGRWVEGTFGWRYHTETAPTVADLDEWLAALPPRRDLPWYVFSGQATATQTATALRKALIDLDVAAALQGSGPLGAAAAGWMIDETWRRPPGAQKHGASEQRVPTVTAALALIGAHTPRLPTISTWIRRSTAIGWLWTDPITGPPPCDSDVMVWRRRPRTGEPHTGALSVGAHLRLAAPSWDRWVPMELAGPPVPGEAAAAYLSREATAADPVGLGDIAELARIDPVELKRLAKNSGLLPPARWLIDGKPAWSRAADIEPWAFLRDDDSRPVPDAPDGPLAAIAAQAADLGTTLAGVLAERDRLILDAHEAGQTLREIAAQAGLTHTGVKRVIDRADQPIPAP